MNNTTNSEFNLQKLNTREYADNVEATIQFGGNLIAIGRRGSAKTSILKQSIEKLGFREVYLNLATMERVDLGGFPNFFNNTEKYIQYILPNFYKDLMEGDRPAVVLFDEADKVDASVLAPLYEFTQFHSINGNGMKKLQSCLMTGNLPSEGGNRFPLPLLDRAEKYLIEINPDHWLDWGAKTGEIHPSIAAYITEHRDDLFGEIDPGEAYADQSARGWHNASKLLFFGEKAKWHPGMQLHKVAGCIGKKVGIKYSAFFEHYQFLLPFVDKVIQGEPIKEYKDFENTKKIVICMILCHRFARMLDLKWEKMTEADKEDFKLLPAEQKISDNIAKFLQKVDPEMAVIAIRGQIGNQRVVNFGLLNDHNWDHILNMFLKKLS